MKGLSVCSRTDNFCRLALGQCFTDSVIRSIGTRTIYSFENYSNIPTSALSILPVIPGGGKAQKIFMLYQAICKQLEIHQNEIQSNGCPLLPFP
jgi:hypothetical protein